jgi:hypothetical protein
MFCELASMWPNKWVQPTAPAARGVGRMWVSMGAAADAGRQELVHEG